MASLLTGFQVTDGSQACNVSIPGEGSLAALASTLRCMSTHTHTFPLLHMHVHVHLAGSILMLSCMRLHELMCAGGKLLLGYPASPSGASSGYLSPSAVVSMVHALAANSTPIAGLMTWSIGCDSTPNEFRSQRCLSHAPKRQSYVFFFARNMNCRWDHQAGWEFAAAVAAGAGVAL